MRLLAASLLMFLLFSPVYGAYIGSVPTVSWGGGQGDFSNAIDLLSSDEPVIGGFTYSFSGTKDGFIVRFDGNGNPVWEEIYSVSVGGNPFHDEVSDLEVLLAQKPVIYVGGSTTNFTHSYGFLLLLDDNGNGICDRVFAPNKGMIGINGLGVNISGDVALVGHDLTDSTGYIALFDSSCQLVGHAKISMRGYEVILWDAEFYGPYIIVSGHIANSTHALGLLMMLDRSLDIHNYVAISISNITVLKDLEISSSRNIVAVGWTGVNYVYDILVLNYTFQLTPNWVATYDYKPFEEAYGLDLDQWGGIYVAGRMDGDTQFDVDTLVLKVFPDGSPWIAYKYNSSDIEEGYDLRAVVGAPQVAVKEYVTGNLRVMGQTLIPIHIVQSYVMPIHSQPPYTKGSPQLIVPPYTSMLTLVGASINSPVDREAYVFVAEQAHLVPEIGTPLILAMVIATAIILVRRVRIYRG